MRKLTFRNGDILPALGLGTWKSPSGKVYDAVLEAIKIGYRHIDCAYIYGNEREIGEALQKAIKDGIVKREDLFITSKLWNNSHHKNDVRPALKQTLADLQLDYLDLYLIHWPVAQKPDVVQPKSEKDFLSQEEAPVEDTWKAMKQLKEEGLAKHIGVANFSIENLKRIMKHSDTTPEVNQVELHPHLLQEELVKFCKENKIIVTGYSPLGSKDRSSSMKKEDEPDLFELDSVKSVAQKHNKTAPQILLAWALNRGVSVIPKSTSKEHIKANFEAADIELSKEEMESINKEDKNYRFVDGSFWTKEGSPYKREYLWGSVK